MASATGSLVQWLAAGVKTTAGVAVASGKVRFFDPGTSTPHTVYSDSALSSAITQPVTLSAGGTALVYTAAPLRMTVKDSADTTTLYDVVVNVVPAEQIKYTSDLLNGGDEFQLSSMLAGWATAAGEHGSTNGFFRYAYSASATERNLKDWMGEVHVSVKDFGAVGNGVANDTAAIQSTITAVGAAGGGVVYFPPGTYLINAALTNGTSGVSLRGAGPTVSVIKNSGAATNAITWSSCNGFSIRGLSITHSSASTGQGIQLASCGSFTLGTITIDAIDVSAHRIGLNLTGTTGALQVTNSNIVANMGNANDRGVQCASTGNHITFVGNNLSAGIVTSPYGVELSGSSQFVRFFGNRMLGATSGLRFNAAFTGTAVTAVGNEIFNGISSGAATFDLNQYGNSIDGYSVDVAVGGNHTPDLTRGRIIRIMASSGGAGTVTVNAPTPAPALSSPQRLTIKYTNASGGAVTWAFAAATFVHVGAAVPASTDLHTITVEYIWDPDQSRWREQSRGDTLT